MRAFRFLSRVAFICNICFLFASFVQWLPHPPEGELVSLVIVLGYVLSILVNILVNLWLGILLFSGKPRTELRPAWLVITNFLFFVTQIILILIPILK